MATLSGGYVSAQASGNFHNRTLISWKAIIAGAFVTLSICTLLMALGLGIGANAAQRAIEEGAKLTEMGSGSAFFLAAGLVIALAAGGYFAARVSLLSSRWLGAAQGLVIASLVLTAMVYGLGQSVGMGLRSMASAVEAGATSLGSSPVVQNVIEDSLADLTLRSDLSTVAKGVVTRLATGNIDSARAYLVSQANVPESVVVEKFAQIQASFTQNLKSFAMTSSNAVAASAYGIFWMSLLGILFACGGGAVGSHMNRKRSIIVDSLTDSPAFQARQAV